MPHYFLHLYDGEFTEDLEGVELADVEDALSCARQSARTMAAVMVDAEGQLVLDHYVAVSNSSGQELARVHFGDVVKVHASQ